MKAALVERLQTNLFAGDDWAAYLNRLGICDERHRRIATEAGLLGGLVAKGIHPMLAIVSDGAGGSSTSWSTASAGCIPSAWYTS
ncbi:MAG: hypothetical protein J5X22_14220 [Candidatus Accumulibacter sp.]|uniref:hypothetical protein n=1 Tax=Accumulibacter sp. TaxID=2053492 RepID=UPI001B008555|nr:hypothetical protein [Accumulibacter sp.]MBO3711606.1 hypothetical protein [Accumulibacter sp.]